MDGRGIGGVLDLALVLQRRRNGGYADLAVAAVETWFVAAGVSPDCAALFLVIFCSVGTLNSTRSSAGQVSQFIEMASECGRNAQQIVSYRDISNRAQMGISSRPMAVEIDVEAARRPLVCS
jgi:hypothetical protein